MIVTDDKNFQLGVMSLSEVDELCKDECYSYSGDKYYVDNASNEHLAASNWMGGVNGSTVWRLILRETNQDYVCCKQFAPTRKDGEYSSGYYGDGDYMPKFHNYTLSDAYIRYGEYLKCYAKRHNHDRWLKTEWLDSLEKSEV